MTGLTRHTIRRVEDGIERGVLVIRAQTGDAIGPWWSRRATLSFGGEDQSFREGQAAVEGDRLDGDVEILTFSKAMRKVDEASSIQMAGCEVTGGSELL